MKPTLRVGQTWKTREGKQVKIIDNDNGIIWPFRGDDGRWRTREGRITSLSSEYPEDFVKRILFPKKRKPSKPKRGRKR